MNRDGQVLYYVAQRDHRSRLTLFFKNRYTTAIVAAGSSDKALEYLYSMKKESNLTPSLKTLTAVMSQTNAQTTVALFEDALVTSAFKDKIDSRARLVAFKAYSELGKFKDIERMLSQTKEGKERSSFLEAIILSSSSPEKTRHYFSVLLKEAIPSTKFLNQISSSMDKLYLFYVIDQLHARKIPITGPLYAASISFDPFNGRERVLAITLKAAAVTAARVDECVIIDSQTKRQPIEQSCDGILFSWERMLSSSDEEFDNLMKTVRLNYERNDLTSTTPPRIIVRVGKFDEKIIRTKETIVKAYTERTRSNNWKKRGEI